MSWNKVLAKTKYKSGVFPVQALAYDTVEVGDKVRILVLSGYVTTCEIIEILQTNVTHTNKCAQIIDKPNKIEKEIIVMYGAKTVEVKHISSERRGVYYTDLDLQVGDTVVYDCGDKTYLHVGTVEDVNPNACSVHSWVVDIIDLSAHETRINKAKEAQRLKARLDAKKKQFQDIELLRLIATSDPETKEMLDSYLALIGGTK